MNTVTFSKKNSYNDFGLLLRSREIGEAEPRTNYIDVPARDGHLDLTEAFGEVKYKNRPLVFTFSYVGSDQDWLPTISALNNYINGQKHKIYFENDYYWVGRCFVKAAQSKNGIREITIECDCEPYKYKIEDTIIEIVVNGENIVKTIVNDRKTVIPQITVISGELILSWTDKKTGVNFNSWAIANGYDNKNLDFKFYEGNNTFTLSGTGSIRLTYKEASL